ncbi:hypothetical protein GOBAR_AA38255 [Gossypium barbadense]|uniref:RING-type E3 ubiquitin transferase n=1 Tax=Gossypium barbadense TaxID=3634 RepID=A0A2P5VUE3_GOSBA|nr:hypothetical protein GOBAR_AA38255 [Gossypium barbadense]
MGTGWRRAFCTTIPRDPENTVIDKQQHQSPSPSPRNCAKLSFFSTGSNPSTPRFQSQPVSSPSLRCRTTVEPASINESPTLHCKTTPRAATKSPKPILSSNPSSPRSPLKLSLFRNSFKFRVKELPFTQLNVHMPFISHASLLMFVNMIPSFAGSMTGAKLQMLKRAMRLVISSLGSADRLSIVAFSATSKRLLPLRRMTAQGQRAARRIIDRLACGQGTSVGDALRKATKVLEDRRERNPVASIMLLSDGQDERVQSNASNQRHHSSHASSTRFAHIEIPVHAFGFGQSGGYSHEPAEDAFAKCVGGLLSVVVQDLRIQLSFASGSAPAEITAVYSCNGKPTVLTSGSVRLGDLYAEEERELLVELKVPTSAVGSSHVMCVRCLYKDPAAQEVVYGRDQALLVPRPNDVRLSAPKIEQLRFFFISTRAIAEARRLIECSNDLTSAYHLLGSARALLMQSNSQSAEEYARGLEVELAELHWRKQQMMEIQRRRVNERERERERESMTVVMDENGEPLTPSSAWRAAEKLAKVAMMKKSLNRVSDLHGFENARF